MVSGFFENCTLKSCLSVFGTSFSPREKSVSKSGALVQCSFAHIGDDCPDFKGMADCSFNSVANFLLVTSFAASEGPYVISSHSGVFLSCKGMLSVVIRQPVKSLYMSTKDVDVAISWTVCSLKTNTCNDGTLIRIFMSFNAL